jgi:hypothetical protein
MKNNNFGEIETYPARMTASDAGEILGFGANEIPILVAKKMLKPLGKPVPNATKYFAAVQIKILAQNEDWLHKATQVLYDYWKDKNQRKTSKTGTPAESRLTEISLSA